MKGIITVLGKDTWVLSEQFAHIYQEMILTF